MAFATRAHSLPDRVSLERPLAGPHLSFNLQVEARRLRREQAYKQHGHNARTLAKYPDVRIVLEVARRGTRFRTHDTDERMVIHTLTGRVRMHLPDGTSVDVHAGQLLALDRAMAHEVEALEECSFLLSLSWPARS
jgi:quercetin dioxygenase-like cupin family protein